MFKKGLMFPLFLAIIAALIYFMVVSSAERRAKGKQRLVPVAISAFDIPERNVIRQGMVRVAKIPAGYAQKDSFEIRTSTDLNVLNGMVTKVKIPKGNQITKHMVSSLTGDIGLSVKVPQRYRGMVIEVDNAVSQLVKPGDKVDIIVTLEVYIRGVKRPVSFTILQNQTVLGVGNNLGQGINADMAKSNREKQLEAAAYTDTSALSLQLSPLDAQYLALTKSVADEITVVVRAIGDEEVYPLEMSDLTRLSSGG